MKVLQVLLLILTFVCITQAQADCYNKNKVYVLDADNKAIQNAKLEIYEITENNEKILAFYPQEIEKDAYFFISVMGRFKSIDEKIHTVGQNYMLRVTAQGFETFEQKIKFYNCKGQDFEIKLKPVKTPERLSILSGTVYDAEGSVVVKAKVTAINQKSEKVETVTNEEGIYTLSLPFNPNSAAIYSIAKYDIIVDATELGFKKSITKNFVFIPSQFGKMQLDLGLEAENPEPCGYASGDCFETPILENTEVKISDKVLQRPLETSPKAKNKNNRKNN